MTAAQSGTDRGGSLYRIGGWRRIAGARQRVTVLRRTGPAAERAARHLEETGRGPVTVTVVWVAAGAWREVIR